MAKVLMAGMGMMAARKKPQALVMEVRVMLGPTWRMLAIIRRFSEDSFIASSITKKASPMTNISSTPKPSTKKGSTCREWEEGGGGGWETLC